MAAITAQLPDNIDPTKATLAYGRGALPRLNRELQAADLLTRQRAVKALCDVMQDPENVGAALHEGVVVSLRGLLEDRDVTVRQLATRCFCVLAQHTVGRDAIAQSDSLLPLSKLFDDPEDICRLNAHTALRLLSEVDTGAAALIDAHLVPSLIDKVRREQEEIREQILETLHCCLTLDTKDALKAHAMEVLAGLLTHDVSRIRAKASRVVLDLAVPLDGKHKAVEVGAVPLLIGLLSDGNPRVRANAAGALALVTVTTQGKYTALNAEAVVPLLPLIGDADSEVRVNALKVVTCLAEAPEGRRILSEHVEKIEDLTNDDVTAVRKHAEIAVRVIRWKP